MRVNKYFDLSSFILNFALPRLRACQLIGIILYLYFREIIFNGISRKILKLSEIKGRKFFKTSDL